MGQWSGWRVNSSASDWRRERGSVAGYGSDDDEAVVREEDGVGEEGAWMRLPREQPGLSIDWPCGFVSGLGIEGVGTPVDHQSLPSTTRKTSSTFNV